MSKHTPGPWWFDWNLHVIVGHRPDSTLPLCIGELFLPIDDGPQLDMLKANAHLIAAAPGLLEVCKKLLEWIDNLEAQGYKNELINALPNNFGRSVARDVIAQAALDPDAIERAQDDYARMEAECELIGFEEER